jgi:Gti1/Pac2 family transcription factor
MDKLLRGLKPLCSDSNYTERGVIYNSIDTIRPFPFPRPASTLSPTMQVPSCTNVRIRSTADVHKIFYAVYLGLLPMITRRLDAKEREALSSGYCYAWEDRGPHAITGIGIERFTEGRHWSASRVRDVCIFLHIYHIIASPGLTVQSQEFLFYYEKWDPPKNKNGERTRLVIIPDLRSCSDPTATIDSDGQPPRDWDPFVKQTYSVYLNENESNKRKWHLSVFIFHLLNYPVLYYN